MNEWMFMIRNLRCWRSAYNPIQKTFRFPECAIQALPSKHRSWSNLWSGPQIKYENGNTKKHIKVLNIDLFHGQATSGDFKHLGDFKKVWRRERPARTVTKNHPYLFVFHQHQKSVCAWPWKPNRDYVQNPVTVGLSPAPPRLAPVWKHLSVKPPRGTAEYSQHREVIARHQRGEVQGLDFVLIKVPEKRGRGSGGSRFSRDQNERPDLSLHAQQATNLPDGVPILMHLLIPAW